jgi:hypothetical protein
MHPISFATDTLVVVADLDAYHPAATADVHFRSLQFLFCVLSCARAW